MNPPTTLESVLGPNWRTTLFGGITMLAIYIALNPEQLSFLPPAWAKGIGSICTLISGFIAFRNAKDGKVSGNGSDSNPAKVAQSDGSQKTVLAPILVGLLVSALALQGCAELRTLQNNPGVQAAETAAISIGGTLATGSPAFAYVAPIAVNGLTAMADGSNPTAVTGTNLAADAALITSTVAAAVPNSTGKKVAAQIANAYVGGVNSSGVTPTASVANAVIGAIASGLTTGVSNAGANGPRGPQGKSGRRLSPLFASRERYLFFPIQIDAGLFDPPALDGFPNRAIIRFRIEIPDPFELPEETLVARPAMIV